MSTLKRMFMYATAHENRPVENFTTEALALAIRSDPLPITTVLSDHGLVPQDQVSRVTPLTQYHIIHKGQPRFIDLVLQVAIDDGSAMEVWFENKCHAPERPGQLDDYQSVIKASRDGIIRHLVALAPNPISTAGNHTFIAWQQVADAAKVSTSVLWAELVEFLKEHRMTADATLPITAGEAASLGEAHKLFRKMRYVMKRVNATARAETPEWPPERWVADRHVKAALVSDFAWNGRLRLREGVGYAATIVWGAEPRADGARFVVLVEADPKRTAVRSRLAEVAERMPEEWVRLAGDRSRMLAKEAPAVDFRTEDEAVKWFLGCLEDLRAAGILALIPTLNKGPVAIEAEGDEDDRDEDVVSGFMTPETYPSGLDRVTGAD